MQNQTLRWRALWQPEMYQAWVRTRNYFEDWYFKLVDRSSQAVFAVMLGGSTGSISRKTDKKQMNNSREL